MAHFETSPSQDHPALKKFRAGTQIKFVSTKDLIDLGQEKVRFGACGVWDLTTRRVAFRQRDMIDCGVLAVYDEEVLVKHLDKLQIEEGM